MLNKWPYTIILPLTTCENRAYYESRTTIYPARPDVLRAFQDMGPDKVRVVVVGQDPYHSTDSEGNIKAYGRAFGYNPRYQGSPNSSMFNIIQEVGGNVAMFDTSLGHWADQGVMLLNTCLTVEAEKPLSHAGKYGWEQAISDVLKYLAQDTDCVFVGWGSKARDVLLEAGISEGRMVITSHPSRYSAKAGPRPFLGSMWHLQVNDKLERAGKEKIVWS